MSRRSQGATDPVWGALVMINEDWTPHALRRAFAAAPDGPGGLGDRRALGRAARVLDARLRGLHDVIAVAELEAWRGYLGEVVTRVSPLLVRACDAAGLDLDSLVERLRPGATWEQWLCGTRPTDMIRLGRKGSGWRRTPPLSESAASDFQEYAHCGMTVRTGPPPGSVFGLRLLNRGLETAVMLGDHRLRTHGRSGSITLRGQKLGSTLRSGLPGVELDRLVDHPLLAGCGAVITGVDEPRPKWGTKVRFALEPVPWRVAWAS